MFNAFKFASLPLGLLLLGACDHEDTTARKGELQDPISCGGFAGLACPDNLSCVDDASDDCDPANGGADCMGVCEAAVDQPGPIACGGFAGLACPDNLSCVDDPKDSCDPANGGADCMGICETPHGHGHGPKPHKPHKTKCGDPDREYVSHDADQCAAIRFKCADGQVAFFDACGCGCESA